jgi:hypothetical protein
MDQATRVECSDEIDDAASSPREEVLFRELDIKVKNISEVVDGVKTAVSAIPVIHDDMVTDQEDTCGAGILQKEYCNGFGFLLCKGRPTVR